MKWILAGLIIDGLVTTNANAYYSKNFYNDTVVMLKESADGRY